MENGGEYDQSIIYIYICNETVKEFLKTQKHTKNKNTIWKAEALISHEDSRHRTINS